METQSFFGKIVQKQPNFVFQNRLFRRRVNNQIAAVMLQLIPKIYAMYSINSLFISANTYEEHIASRNYSIVYHDDKMRFLTNCRYHILLKGDIEELV